MGGEERSAAPDLTRLERLIAEPKRFHIFKALRLIEAVYTDCEQFGRSRRPHRDPVLLEQEPELAFPPSTVLDFEPRTGNQRGRLSNRFFGLWGPHGPLPLHLTEYARDRLRNERDPTLVAFANVFHHRMIGLLYRAWATAEPAPNYDREDGFDVFRQRLAAAVGLKGDALRDRDAMPDGMKLAFSGRLSQAGRNEEGLLAIISHFFTAKVEVHSFVGCWLPLDESDLFSFRGRPTQKPRGRLGRGVTVGDRVWSRQAKFRIRIGPLTLGAYHRLLPKPVSEDGEGHASSLQRLKAIVRNYLGDTLDWDVNLVLRADEVPTTRLGMAGELGWTTWIGQRPAGQDADELMLGADSIRSVRETGKDTQN